jgi:hypothetical protein
MRSVVYTYISGLTLTGFTLSEKLPWEDNKGPLYDHNKKTIYVDVSDTQQSANTDTFDSKGFVQETITVRVYLMNDAKQLPSGYDEAIELIKGARTATGTETYQSRTVQVTRTYSGDYLLTTFEFTFKRTLTN